MPEDYVICFFDGGNHFIVGHRYRKAFYCSRGKGLSTRRGYVMKEWSSHPILGYLLRHSENRFKTAGAWLRENINKLEELEKEYNDSL